MPRMSAVPSDLTPTLNLGTSTSVFLSELTCIVVQCIVLPCLRKNLSLLSEGESYGYALIQEVKRLSGDKIEWTDGMLYPVLHRMEREGWIESRWGEAENGRKRKYYSLKKD